jgi:hypothetical protein
MAFLKMEPPDEGDNYRTAMLLTQITNMAGKSLPKGKKVKPEDFIGKPEANKVQRPEDHKAFFLTLRGNEDG